VKSRYIGQLHRPGLKGKVMRGVSFSTGTDAVHFEIKLCNLPNFAFALVTAFLVRGEGMYA
jgi:hypothetical protein